MSVNLDKLKNLLNVKTFVSNDAPVVSVEPQIGFKVSYSESTKLLKVKLIGARHLPTVYGTLRPAGYIVKVRVFPGKEKYETDLVQESWPSFNDEFIFDLSSNLPTAKIFLGKFVSFTMYAILENSNNKNSLQRTIGRRFKLFSTKPAEINRNSKTRLSKKVALNNRRTVGAVTYNLDCKAFTQILKNKDLATPDVWRKLEPISSGVLHEHNDRKNGSIEVTMTYSESEDGFNDTIEISLQKMRCSMQTMQEHEKLGGQLYIKVTAFEFDVLIAKLKSDRFDPTISLKIEPKTATLFATVNRQNLDRVKVIIRLMCKNILGKKHLLGKIELDSHHELWKEVIKSPCNPVTKMIDME